MRGASGKEVEPLGLSNTVFVLNQVKPKAALLVDISVT